MISKLIIELKKEHLLIKKTFNKIKDFNIKADKRKLLFKDAKQFLSSHIKKEDEFLYPLLWKKAEIDNNLKHTLELCMDDMNNIAQEVQNFFSKYEDKEFGDEFYSELGKLCADISQRIIYEEEVIYEKYEEIITDKK